MTVFDRAWGILKQYVPNWRENAEHLLDLENIDSYLSLYPNPEEDGERFRDRRTRKEIDGDTAIESPNKYPDFLGEGTKVGTFIHPLDKDFVAKVPYLGTWHQKQFDKRGQQDDSIRFLEEIGYPIVGEMGSPSLPIWENEMGGMENKYRVQPRLNRVDGSDEQIREVDTILSALVGDRQHQNYGVDSKGLVRMFDLDMFGQEMGWAVDDPESHQEALLGSYGIQHPASRILNNFERTDKANDPNYKLRHFLNYLELLEPYSDNPNELTVHGKPKWLEGY